MTGKRPFETSSPRSSYVSAFFQTLHSPSSSISAKRQRLPERQSAACITTDSMINKNNPCDGSSGFDSINIVNSDLPSPPHYHDVHLANDPDFGKKVCEAFQRSQMRASIVTPLRIAKYGVDIAERYRRGWTPDEDRAAYQRRWNEARHEEASTPLSAHITPDGTESEEREDGQELDQALSLLREKIDQLGHPEGKQLCNAPESTRSEDKSHDFIGKGMVSTSQRNHAEDYTNLRQTLVPAFQNGMAGKLLEMATKLIEVASKLLEVASNTIVAGHSYSEPTPMAALTGCRNELEATEAQASPAGAVKASTSCAYYHADQVSSNTKQSWVDDHQLIEPELIRGYRLAFASNTFAASFERV